VPVVTDPGALVLAIGDVVYDWDIASDVLAWSANAQDVLDVADLTRIGTGRGFSQVVDVEARPMRADIFAQAVPAGHAGAVPYQMEYALRPRGAAGMVRWVEECGRWLPGPDGRPRRAFGTLRMIDERHEREQRLASLSRIDALTGEMSRTRLVELLDTVLAEAVRARSSCGFLLVAIDNLAGINEAYGYDIADELIVSVAGRLRSRMRARDHLGRYSGNKFGVILHDCTTDDLAVAADRLLSSLREGVLTTAAGGIAVTATIGGVTAPRFARSAQEVQSRAQEALDAAKSRRRGSFQAYHPDPERETRRRANISLTDEIVTALNERRISLAHEPVASARTRAPAFYECLLRLRHADGSLLPAQAMVPAAERLGLMRLLDHRVLELVVAELADAPSFHASLNVSPLSTMDPDWWSGFSAMLRTHPGAAKRLIVEITETAAIQDLDETRHFVARIKDLGVRVAIDDFGAGYTSFRNLRKLAVDIVKIDGSFIENFSRSGDDRAFVRSLLDLAQRLDLQTVAEWVQDEQTAATLAEWGCDYIQGALVGLASCERPWLAAGAAPGAELPARDGLPGMARPAK